MISQSRRAASGVLVPRIKRPCRRGKGAGRLSMAVQRTSWRQRHVVESWDEITGDGTALPSALAVDPLSPAAGNIQWTEDGVMIRSSVCLGFWSIGQQSKQTSKDKIRSNTLRTLTALRRTSDRVLSLHLDTTKTNL